MASSKTLNKVQGRINGTDDKGFMMWATRVRRGNKVLYTLYAEDATVECGETSNGFFEGLVEFVGHEYELGIREF